MHTTITYTTPFGQPASITIEIDPDTGHTVLSNGDGALAHFVDLATATDVALRLVRQGIEANASVAPWIEV
jgi:hypothetical protein